MDTSSYCNFLRMDSSSFEELLTAVAPLIAKSDTVFRDAIPPGERLSVTLRFLATGNNNALNVLLCNTCIGESFESLKFLYRISAQSIGKIVPETCKAVIEVLCDKYMKVSLNTT